MTNGDENVHLLLVYVSALQRNPLSTSAEIIQNFSIQFEGLSEVFLPQKIYTFEHVSLGRFDLFIVPIGKDKSSQRMRYEAIFN